MGFKFLYKLYFYQSYNGGFSPIGLWVKVYRNLDNLISCIYTKYNINHILNVDVSEYDNFMEEIYVHRGSNRFFIKMSDLNNPSHHNENFNTHIEEIELDFNGDIELWKRNYSIESNFIPRGDYRCRVFDLNKCSDTDIWIPFDDIDQFSGLVGSDASVLYPSCPILTIPEIIRIKRDMVINNILSN